jgi:molybdopterin/thiamine biosynthesis adenylyltransferase
MESSMSRLNRQSFLGPHSDSILAGATIGFVGLGGGGSHIVQQCAHAGIGGYVLVDPDTIDDTNTNRLVGGTLADVEAGMAKTAIAARLIRGLQPGARIIECQCSWHDATNALKCCDVIVGAVDSFKERDQLERFARRNLIPDIDMGMDVWRLPTGEYFIGGQIILSSPGSPCLRCCGVVTDQRLAEEARSYCNAGPRPQVVWPNGVLASTAVGMLMQLVTSWHHKAPSFAYLEYDGNRGTIMPSKRMEFLKAAPCPHHPLDETGDPLFDIREHLKRPSAPVVSPVQPPSPSTYGLLGAMRNLWRRIRRT